MKRLCLITMALFVCKVLSAQKIDFRVPSIHRNLNPLIAEILYQQNERSGLSKPSSIQKRLVLRTSDNAIGTTDSSTFYYSGNRGSELDIKTNKGYMESNEFNAILPFLPTSSSRRKRYLLCDSFIQTHFNSPHSIEYYRYTSNDLLDSLIRANATDSVPAALVSYKLSYSQDNHIKTTTYNGAGNGAVLNSRIFHTYDANGFLIQDSLITFINSVYVSYYFRTTQGLLTKFRLLYSSSNGSFDTTDKYNFFYDNQDRLTMVGKLAPNGSQYSAVDSLLYAAGSFPQEHKNYLYGVLKTNNIYYLNATTNELDSIYYLEYESSGNLINTRDLASFTYNADLLATEWKNFRRGAFYELIDSNRIRFFYEDYNTSSVIAVEKLPTILGFPNPVKTLFHFSILEPRNYWVSNLSGQILKQGTITKGVVDFSDLMPSIYTIRVEGYKPQIIQKIE